MVISPVNIEERKGIDMKVGDTVRIHIKIEEKGKTRLQVFEGLVISRNHGREAGATFTVRKTASGVGVEKTFPLYSPNIAKIEIVGRGKARRAKLYYIRDKAAKQAAKKIRGIRFASAVMAADETKPQISADDTKSQISADDTQTDADSTEVATEAPVADVVEEGVAEAPVAEAEVKDEAKNKE